MERSCMCCQESGEREAAVSLFCPKAKPGERKFRKVRIKMCCCSRCACVSWAHGCSCVSVCVCVFWECAYGSRAHSIEWIILRLLLLHIFFFVNFFLFIFRLSFVFRMKGPPNQFGWSFIWIHYHYIMILWNDSIRISAKMLVLSERLNVTHRVIQIWK